MPNVVIPDVVYGTRGVSAPVLRELLASKPIHRLKGISQFGFPDALYHKDGFSRYDHCVGVMLLLGMLGASEEEQVAGLLHDASHTAFSHVIDWVVNTKGRESFQDSVHGQYLRSTEVPGILSRHGYDVDRVCDLHAFSLLEQDSPRLCADRVDYALREMSPDVVRACLSAFVAFEQRIVCTDIGAARLFAENFLRLQAEHWGGFEAVSRYKLFSGMLKGALERQDVTFEDFWQDEAAVLHKLRATGNPDVLRTLEALSNRSLAGWPRSDEPIRKKFRYVDPDVLVDGHVGPLSRLDEAFADRLQAARLENEQGMRPAMLA